MFKIFSAHKSTSGVFVKSSIFLILMLVANKVLGFAEKLVLANYFGTSSDADIFIVAQGLFLTGWVFVEEIIGPSLIPLLTTIRSKDSEQTKLAITQKVIIVLTPLILCFALVTFHAQPLMARIFFPGFNAEACQKLHSLWGYFCFAMVPFYLTPVLQSYANSKKLFFAPALAGVVGRIFMIICFVAFIQSTGIIGAGIGMVIYASVFFGLLILLLKFPLQLVSKKILQFGDNELLLGRLALPLVIGTLFSQFSQLIDMRYASMLPQGTLSSISFSKKLIDVPVLVISFCIGAVLLPYIAEFFNTNQIARFKKYFLRSVIICVTVYGSATIIFMMFSVQIVTVVFGRGKFDTNSVLQTAQLLMFFAPGLLAFSLEIILMQASFAVRNHWQAIITGLICASANIIATILLVPKFGAIIIPIALVSQKATKTVILWILLNRKLTSQMNSVALPSTKLL